MPGTDENRAPESDRTDRLISDFVGENPNAAMALEIWANACSSYEEAMRQYFLMPTVYAAVSSSAVPDRSS